LWILSQSFCQKIWVPVWQVASLGMTLHLSETQLPDLQNGYRLNENGSRCLFQCLTCRSSGLNGPFLSLIQKDSSIPHSLH
jgi:hypothetical protein